MTSLLRISTLITTLSFSGLAVATDVVHFEGKASNTLPEAVANFSEYNDKLEAVMEGELTPEAMSEVHQLSYTLENAIAKMSKELDSLAETLEEVHLASESADTETVSEQGAAYLETSRELVE
ncbi:DUF6746 family protein [Marinobacter zhanjiangensis]|uniref:Soluble cytochrome b562 n=1 Tax=Marinobacter zhanjiangensis TaxID=578215 RepID=A0ABQ3AMH1_9GAMM|nr:DUF6746 family protein [Marinobacter zhanjiangensis]GGY60672.1 hypothetical protein GCM10007071_04210 [Marinobacter zhanjiangensis]